MYKSFLLLISCVLLVSCDFENTNIDPYKKSSALPSELLPVAIAQSAFNSSDILNIAAGCFIQHWDQPSASSKSFSIYKLSKSTFNGIWNEGAYGGVLKTSNSIIQLARQDSEVQYEAIASILIAKELGNLTSSFGDIPYSKAFNPNIPEVAYDTQEKIYETIQELLDHAIRILETSDGTIAGDLIFNGDYSSWIQTAYALKARYYMHLSKRDTDAGNKALVAIEQAFKSNNDQPDFKFGLELEAANPFAKLAIERAYFLILHEKLYLELIEKADPRMTNYMYQGSNDQKSVYNYDASEGLFWSRNESPSPLISYTELKFLEAEALLRIDKISEAESAMKEAVSANMQYFNIDKTSTDAYILNHVTFAGLNTTEEQIEKIIEEKYQALYFQGSLELWVDYRRTGYPVLVPNSYGTNELNPEGLIPQRLIYPQNEYETNYKNVTAAATNINGDLLSSKLWAFE